MRKTLLATCALLFSMMSNAQTKDAPLTLTVGENSHDTGAQSTDVYWKYTAEQNQLLTISAKSTESYSTYFYGAYLIAETDTTALSITSDAKYNKVVAVTAGQTILLETRAFANAAGATAVCQLTVEANNDVPGLGTGIAADNQLVVVPGKTQFVGDQTQSGSQTSYLTYTATEDGQLAIYLSNSVQSATVNGEAAATEFNSEKGGYVLKAQIETGKTYNIVWQSYGVQLISSEILHPILGSLEMPITLKAGANEIPAAKGEYYFTFVPEKTGYAVFSSEETIPGGQVLVYQNKANIQYNNPLATSEQGSLNVKFEISTIFYSPYLKVVKVEDTEAAQTWNFAIEDYKVGQKEDNPIVIENVPAEGLKAETGATYFKVNVPAGKTGFLVAEATSAVTNAMSSLKVYPAGNSWNGNSGQTIAKYEVNGGEAGAAFFILVNNAETSDIEFKVYYEDVKQGDLITNPLTAVLGENKIDRNGTVYYSYTPTKDCKVVFTVAPNIELAFPQSTSPWAGVYDSYKVGATYTLYAEKDNNYLITVSGAAADDVMEIAEVDFVAGDTKALAVEVVDNKYVFDDKAPVCKWLKYVVTEDGYLVAECDTAYSYDQGALRINIGVNEGYMTPMVSYDADYMPIFKSEVSVVKGDTVYVNITGSSAVEGATLSFAMREANPGETVKTAINMEVNTAYDIPAASGSSSYWVKATLKAGSYTLKATGSMSAFYYLGEENALTENLIGNISLNNYDENYQPTNDYTAKLEITEEGEYFFNLMYIYSACKLTIVAPVSDAISRVNVGKTISVADGQLNIEADNADVKVFSLSGAQLFGEQVKGKAQLRLNKGIYLVNVNGETKKVMVK